MNWTEENRIQFKNLLKIIPYEDIALVTAIAWCKEFNLKFDEYDQQIARHWHRYFHKGSLEATTGKLCLYIKNERGAWYPVKDMSTCAICIWKCLSNNESFMRFDALNDGCKRMIKNYANAAKEKGFDVKIIEV